MPQDELKTDSKTQKVELETTPKSPSSEYNKSIESLCVKEKALTKTGNKEQFDADRRMSHVSQTSADKINMVTNDGIALKCLKKPKVGLSQFAKYQNTMLDSVSQSNCSSSFLVKENLNVHNAKNTTATQQGTADGSGPGSLSSDQKLILSEEPSDKQGL